MMEHEDRALANGSPFPRLVESCTMPLILEVTQQIMAEQSKLVLVQSAVPKFPFIKVVFEKQCLHLLFYVRQRSERELSLNSKSH